MRQLLNLVKKGTGETREAETYDFSSSQVSGDALGGVYISRKTLEGERTENKQKAQTQRSHAIKHYA